jgi:hypothetical protein
MQTKKVQLDFVIKIVNYAKVVGGALLKAITGSLTVIRFFHIIYGC